jgi:hypothetical protein
MINDTQIQAMKNLLTRVRSALALRSACEAFDDLESTTLAFLAVRVWDTSELCPRITPRFCLIAE